MDKSHSESDLNQFLDVEVPLNRGKRRREENEDSNSDIKCFISSLMAEQQKEIKKIGIVLTEVRETNKNIENSIAFLTAQNEEFKNKIEKLEKQAERDKEYILNLENKIEDLQISSRKSNFEIKNVPKGMGETKEELVDMVLQLSNTVNCKIEKNDIKDIYRIRNKKKEVRNTPIIVETSSTILKTEFLQRCKNYNIKHKTKLTAKHVGNRTNPDTPIFVSEQLTAKRSRLYFLARDLVKNKKFKYCWTAFGKVYLRKDENSRIITITSETQIHQLTQET